MLRAGFTLVELLVAIAISAVLLALLIPAVAAGRASARRLTCVNNLKQVGLAAQSRVSSYGTFPYDGVPLDSSRDEGSVWEQVASSLEMSDVPLVGKDGKPRSLPLLVCPSDSETDEHSGLSNYHWSDGYGEQAASAGVYFARSTGSNASAPVKPSDIADGLSNTALVSEVLLSYPTDRVPPARATTEADGVAEPLRFRWYVDKTYLQPDEFQAFVAACRAQRTFVTPHGFVRSGLGDWTTGVYDHGVPPNSPGCLPGPRATSVDDWATYSLSQLDPASSLHSGGVNLLLCDGSVRFMSEGIDGAVWQAIGTAAAGDAAAIK